MRSALLAAAATLAIAAVAHAEAAPEPDAKPAAVALAFERYSLPNGLDVILHEDHRVPVVAVNVGYHVGAKDDPAGRSGLAHLFERLMFQGSRHVGPDMFLRYVERAGASDRGGTTSADRSAYFETLPSSRLELALWLESDRMAYLLDHLDDATLARQRDVVRNERRQRFEDAPYGRVSPLVREALYPEDHPYHRAAIGAPADLDAATLDDARSFFRAQYVPNDATLVLAGDFQPALAKALIAQYFGPIPRGGDAPAPGPRAPVVLAGEKRLEIAANVELPRVVVSWHAPPAFAPGHAELEVLANLLARGKTSRLYEHLVYDRRIAQSVSASFAEAQLGGVFEITATLRKGTTPEEGLAVVDQILDALRASPPAGTEMERAIAYTVSDAVFPLQRVTARADALSRAAQLAGDPGMVGRLVERVQHVAPADLTAAIAAWLPRDRRVVALVRPDPAAPRAGELLGTTR